MAESAWRFAEGKKREAENFQGSETVLYDTIMVG